ncbi:MAG TPA: hypothetical protein VK466_16425 [Terriglobales bacterium]|nr:hypothetical protein [Terriglobales bacterium]
MFGRDRMGGTWLLASILGIASLTFAQQPGDNQPPAPPQDAPAATTPAPIDPDLLNQVQQLQAEVDQLKAQIAQLNSVVEQLQNERTIAVAPAEKPSPKKNSKKVTASSGSKRPAMPATPPSTLGAEEPTPTTVLVFHDGHRMEARNYAIVGQTLWIYTQDESQKVPLSELDVAATKNANSDRGIIFQMPPSR